MNPPVASLRRFWPKLARSGERVFVVGPGMERKTKRRSGKFPRSFLVFFVALASLSIPSVVSAQSQSEVREKVRAGGHSESEVRQHIDDSGMSPDEIRKALKDAGYDPDALNEYLPGGKQSPGRGAAEESSGAAAQAPSGALTAPLEPPAFTEPSPKPKIRPEDWPEFTKEIARRVHTSDPVLPFGYEIFGYLPATFEPLAAGPVDPDYPIGPGDEVVVQVWGDNQFTHAAVVSREATISVPDIGQVVLNGLSLSQAK